jgi:hypothetical protein
VAVGGNRLAVCKAKRRLLEPGRLGVKQEEIELDSLLFPPGATRPRLVQSVRLLRAARGARPCGCFAGRVAVGGPISASPLRRWVLKDPATRFKARRVA